MLSPRGQMEETVSDIGAWSVMGKFFQRARARDSSRREFGFVIEKKVLMKLH